MKTNNNLIAEFMGFAVVNKMPQAGIPESTFILEKNLKYNKSWDWLMPVVEKINNIDGYSCLHIDHDGVFLHRNNAEMLYFEKEIEGSKIATVYRAVVEFIKWYNSQTRPQEQTTHGPHNRHNL